MEVVRRVRLEKKLHEESNLDGITVRALLCEESGGDLDGVTKLNPDDARLPETICGDTLEKLVEHTKLGKLLVDHALGGCLRTRSV